MSHPGFTRNFESTLVQLAERGHRIHLAFDGPPQVGKPGAVQLLGERYTEISHGPAPERDDVWSTLAGAARATRNYLRYLHPRYRRADRLRERALVWPLAPLLVTLSERPLGGMSLIRALDALLRGVEQVIPSSRDVERFIAEQAPDAVLVTPLIDFNSPQVDHLKAARALGVPTGLCVASWDNLTNKGLVLIEPDLVTVWNQAQVREAVELHGIPAEKVVVTGAQLFDEWFARRPSTLRAEFCRRIGLPSDRPVVLYTCSSVWIAPHEVPFARRWLHALRSSDGPLRDAGVLIRPHPQNAAQWDGVDLCDLGPVAVWPRDPAQQVDARSKADFFDSLSHSAAVVGINTSALIEAGIVGRPVFTVLDQEFRSSQEGTLHFQHLVNVSGGLLRVAGSLDEHVGQLGAALAEQAAIENADAVDPGDGERAREFVRAFVRPLGLDLPATPLLVAAIERLRTTATQPDRPPRWTPVARPLLFGLALLARGVWLALRRYERRRLAESPLGISDERARTAILASSRGAVR
ncbi:MAG: hypothetical protein IT305_10885 [Chloroflexi bacterium]|nr:hypothetical protein [Chloroflexota bacterium]